MLELYRARKRLERRLRASYKTYGIKPNTWPPKTMEGDNASAGPFNQWSDERMFARNEHQIAVTTHLVAKAVRRGIEVPTDANLWSEAIVSDEPHRPTQRVLTEAGQARLLRHIRDDFRASVKWWADILMPIATILSALGGVWLGAHISRPR